MKAINDLTANKLRDTIDYNKSTGVFTWKVNRQGVAIGGVAGGLRTDGYLTICIDGIKRRAHRLAWLYIYGHYPKGDIDHINGIRDDNRLVNLRDVSPLDNQRNTALSKNNKSGFVGVGFIKSSSKWRARIKVNRKEISLGEFNKIEDAIEARSIANIKYGFHKNHGKTLKVGSYE